ncbi:hypothetical protein KUCAC02_012943 [Chaenocephalus aceratus]|uniref:Uncharacterized protein n=1 Tax=Chaenocephalus aceratus TaxID=36190 RepID=A0ACB9XC94_CHAAC|nr:hypothetical protein KUCAC02_012943 [Chaenocephalus aceratus]
MSPVPKVRLSGGLEICRVLNGMWQVSGAHGAVNNHKAVEAMQAYVDAGSSIRLFLNQEGLDSSLPFDLMLPDCLFILRCSHDNRSIMWGWKSQSHSRALFSTELQTKLLIQISSQGVNGLCTIHYIC